jgi:hypothetical protein
MGNMKRLLRTAETYKLVINQCCNHGASARERSLEVERYRPVCGDEQEKRMKTEIMVKERHIQFQRLGKRAMTSLWQL